MFNGAVENKFTVFQSVFFAKSQSAERNQHFVTIYELFEPQTMRIPAGHQIHSLQNLQCSDLADNGPLVEVAGFLTRVASKAADKVRSWHDERSKQVVEPRVEVLRESWNWFISIQKVCKWCWGDAEAHASWNCLLRVESTQFRSKKVGREAKIARVLVEDWHQVIANDIAVGVQEIRCIVLYSSCKMTDYEQVRIMGLHAAIKPLRVSMLCLDLRDITFRCSANGAFGVQNAKQTGTQRWYQINAWDVVNIVNLSVADYAFFTARLDWALEDVGVIEVLHRLGAQVYT